MTFTSGEILSQSVRCRWAVAARDFSGVSPCRSESGGSAGDVSSLPASWLPRIDRLAPHFSRSHSALVTGSPLVFNLTDATLRQLASSPAPSRVDARELRRHIAASVFSTNRTPFLASSLTLSCRYVSHWHDSSPTRTSQTPFPASSTLAGGLSHADATPSALTNMCPRSPTRRMPLLARVPAHWY